MTTPPKRIQRKRTRGWKMPDGAIYVGRPTKWGNPYDWRDWIESWPFASPTPCPWEDETNRDSWCKAMAADAFREDINLPLQGVLAVTRAEVRTALRGKTLACWCRVDQSCHADVLLEIANA